LSARVLIHVQSLLGSGHLVRAARIARGLAEAGFEAHLASGGGRVADAELGGARLHDLPAMRAADAGFTRIVDDAGREIDDAFRARRRDALLALFARIRPRILVTELFPFGRRQCRFELLPLLDEARATNPRPLIVCSLRDILQAKSKPERAEETLALLTAYYDLTLVHGDTRLVALDDSFPAASRIAPAPRYTGYIAPPPLAAATEHSGEVLISAGGSGVGVPLLDTALRARTMSRLKDRVWRFLLGGGIDPAAARALAENAGPGVVVEPARADFLPLLAGAAVSVSQAGYNTVMDLLTVRTRAVLVPYVGPPSASSGETEQSLRAERIEARLGGVVVVAEKELAPERLAAAIDRAAEGPRPDPGRLGLDLTGVATTARILQAALA
jgi:predicted glycosyltransferase